MNELMEYFRNKYKKNTSTSEDMMSKSTVKNAIADLCDEYLYIKMNENCESLNASVAASILLYEINNK